MFILFVYVLFSGAVNNLLNKCESSRVSLHNRNAYVREEV